MEIHGRNSQGAVHASSMPLMHEYSVIKRNGKKEVFNQDTLRQLVEHVAQELAEKIDCAAIIREVARTVFDGMTTADIQKALVLASTVFIEKDPAYGFLAARLLLAKLKREIFATDAVDIKQEEALYRQAFIASITTGVALEFFDKRMAEFDLDLLSSRLDIRRDNLLDYMGMQTLYERYFFKHKQQRYELPQIFWMRVAMGLTLEEHDKNAKALECYEILSSLLYTPSTPTLFHAGFVRAQLSSCYLNTVGDDLGEIFKCLGDNAQMAKWAGGLGTDWTNVRGCGAYIKSIKATSQGVVPYLKIANDVVVAITRSGIRRGGSCAYLEVWHLDIEDFLDLRRNTGDERRRTHDMNTAVWIPDLFMKRVEEDGVWTLFSPHETSDLHHIYGAAFEKQYKFYETLIGTEKVTQYMQLPAKQLWRKILTRLFETGHPWITFKDPCNIRSPQDHKGVIHCSNLCTEITLNTSTEETAVCNLGSINLKEHIKNGILDEKQLERTVTCAIRMLDNVVDLNFYPTPEGRNSNMQHRPLGLGIMGFQDALFKLNIPFSSQSALEFADSSMEKISYYAIKASALLAKERGAYPSYRGSKWDRGLFPLDTLDLLEKERGIPIEIDRTSRMDWDTLKSLVAQHGMRNSNLMAIAPTATISTISGTYPCLEPIFKNIYVKSNASGEFTVINSYLVEDLKMLHLWDQEMLDQLKYYDGDIERIARIPAALKEKYKTAFELDPDWLLKITATRGKWIDQSQSHNIFIKGASGKKISDTYRAAWRYGLKTTYYMRTLAASQVEKSTLDAKTYGFTQKREYQDTIGDISAARACNIENTDCESCQ